LMEGIIHDCIIFYLRKRGLISKQQFGFLAKRSTGLQLLSTLSDWVSAIQNRKCVDAMYIDYQKAFDSVSHPKLILKMQAYGIGAELLTWITNFLSDRKQCVVLDDCKSGFRAVTSGVPQGSVLGLLLFLIFINDLPECFSCESCYCKMFADDAKFNYIFSREDDNHVFCRCLSHFCTWSDTWQLRIAFQKCSVLHLGVGNAKSDYALNGINIAKTDYVRDLGISISTDLKFTRYISEISASAKNRISLLFRAFRTQDFTVLVRAFYTYVRPLVEYETVVWSSHLLKDIDSIESVQCYFTRRLFARCKIPYVDYAQRLTYLKMDTLEKRRVKNDLICTYKILNNLVDIDANLFFNVTGATRTSGNVFKLCFNKGTKTG
jgi:ribonuclease P/MRP protein subunit RPP40